MATKKKKAEAPGARDSHVDGLFAGMRDAAQEDLKRTDIVLGTELDRLFVGLPLPALALRYLLQLPILPLSCLIQITGEEGTAKTATMLEIMRWHMVFGGGAVFIENENKYSKGLTGSIFGWNPQWLRRFELIRTRSMEQWQSALTTTMDIARSQQNDPKTGRTIPICWGIDSLMGTNPEKIIEDMLETGHAKLGFPIAARLISEYARSLPNLIADYPFTLIGTNHLKPGQNAQGLPTAAIPGGKAVKFYETFELEMHHDTMKDINKANQGGLRLVIKCRKNSAGPSRKQIQVSMLWWHEDINGEWLQRTVWDWHSSTVQLWQNFQSGGGADTKNKTGTYKQLQAICDFNVEKGQTCWSRALSIPKSDPVPFYTAAQELEKRPDLLEEIHKVLGIPKCRMFQPGMDYAEVRLKAALEGVAASRSLYGNIAALPQVGLPEVAPIAPEAPLAPSSEERADADAAAEAGG